MPPNRVTKAKATKKSAAKPTTKPAKLAQETSRDLLEERLEFLLTCIKETGMKIDFGAVARHYGITTNAATLRFRRAKDCAAKPVRAREAAQESDQDPEPTED
ncbi:hypothetical protein PENFLA_c069G05059 [Penicillium flavigenum]|uniref:Myb-like DNA-binding domain-containing protein n=1 Tax=Penicillium flavigenum TaxID=254877 RepID=A0A1V6SDB8_9EURO|nr:hypothetical protein PENFLA_c069G05059 [Penicillium flavigenum]